MRELIITGEHPLQGEVTVQGAKNSVLPILAATLLTNSQVELRGCPHLRDVTPPCGFWRHWDVRPAGKARAWWWTPPG